MPHRHCVDERFAGGEAAFALLARRCRHDGLIIYFASSDISCGVGRRFEPAPDSEVPAIHVKLRSAHCNRRAKPLRSKRAILF
jgi:hypothetical protein